MPKYLFSIIIFLISIFVSTSEVKAITDPLAVPNNKFGIHIHDEHDLDDAAKLVNSSGGDYGYITFVIREDEKDPKRWGEVFDKARKLHLIPIVRIATKQGSEGWIKPTVDEIDGWVSLLNSLNWISENRYVIIGNEPNHASEWGGSVNPEEYADYLSAFSKKLKEASTDFFILPAGLDASAPDNHEHLSEETFIKRMLAHNKNIFDSIDGWASHSYPNPDFSGSETARGKGTIHTYEWEMSLLSELGIHKKLPIFITETGWAHNVEDKKSKYLSQEDVSEKMIGSYRDNFKNPAIVAVTPFILNYLESPFNIFSWKKPDNTFYDFYYRIQELPKVKGVPKQIVASEVISFLSPPIIKKDDKLFGLVYLKNNGQTIWKSNQSLDVKVLGREVKVEPIIFLSEAEPGEKTLALYEMSK